MGPVLRRKKVVSMPLGAGGQKQTLVRCCVEAYSLSHTLIFSHHQEISSFRLILEVSIVRFSTNTRSITTMHEFVRPVTQALPRNGSDKLVMRGQTKSVTWNAK